MKVAIVLFNLGGPDSPKAVRPFLRNLFNDPAIIDAPRLIRWFLSHWISIRRAPIAQGIYEHLGGKSPLLELTRQQADALEQNFTGADDVKTFIAMRYWHPMSDETARAVKDFAPDRIILLPLYPQFSMTTTGSSLTDWNRAAEEAGLDVQTIGICCYPEAAGLIEAISHCVEAGLSQVKDAGKPRVLFSAHGLPKKIVDKGDPYPDHIERTAAAVVDALGKDDLDWIVCYQSRVGPLEWIGPSIDDEIVRAGMDGVPVVVVPIAFVSEHSETLVELDIEYREFAEQKGVPAYHRTPTPCSNPDFIVALKILVERALESTKPDDRYQAFKISSPVAGRICSATGVQCPNK